MNDSQVTVGLCLLVIVFWMTASNCNDLSAIRERQRYDAQQFTDQALRDSEWMREEIRRACNP